MTRRVFAARVDSSTPAVIESLAATHGCYRAGPKGELVGAAGVLLDRIARGELQIVITGG